MEQVAKISQTIADELLINPDWIVDVVTHSDGYPCINLEDASFFLDAKNYQVKDWIPYFVNGLEIGRPKPRVPRKY